MNSTHRALPAPLRLSRAKQAAGRRPPPPPRSTKPRYVSTYVGDLNSLFGYALCKYHGRLCYIIPNSCFVFLHAQYMARLNRLLLDSGVQQSEIDAALDRAATGEEYFFPLYI